MAINPKDAQYLSRYVSENGRILAECQQGSLYRVSVSGYGLPAKTLIDLYCADQQSLSLLAHALQGVTSVLVIVPQEQQKGESSND